MDGSSLSISFADSLPAYAIESGPSEPGGGGTDKNPGIELVFTVNLVMACIK